jgi:hypothetical protein
MFPGVKTPGYSQDVPPGQGNAVTGISAKHATRMKSELIQMAFRWLETFGVGNSFVIRHLSFGFLPT